LVEKYYLVYNSPPGVIDSPGLCDTDLAKATLNDKKKKKNKTKNKNE